MKNALTSILRVHLIGSDAMGYYNDRRVNKMSDEQFANSCAYCHRQLKTEQEKKDKICSKCLNELMRNNPWLFRGDTNEV